MKKLQTMFEARNIELQLDCHHDYSAEEVKIEEIKLEEKRLKEEESRRKMK